MFSHSLLIYAVIVSENGDIAFLNEITIAPNLCVGGQLGLAHNFDLRVAIHLPRIVGG